MESFSKSDDKKRNIRKQMFKKRKFYVGEFNILCVYNVHCTYIFKGRGFGSLISGAISDQIGVRSTLKIFGFACKYISIFL